MPRKRTPARAKSRIRGTKERKQSKKTAKQSAGSKPVSHSKKSTPTKKASKAKKKPIVSAIKRDAKGRFLPKVKKNVTKERFKKAGLPYKPKKPHAPVLRRKRTIVKKDTTHLKRYEGAPTNRDRDGKPKFVPNVRSDPFRTVPSFNPDTKTTFDPNSLFEEIRQSLETELDTIVSGRIEAVINHGDFLFHEYTFIIEKVSVKLADLEDLFNIARPYLRPHYRSLTDLIALVGFEHETRQQMEIGPRSLSSTTYFDHAFMGLPKAVERWGTATSYRAICGIAVHVRAPDWMQPKDKQRYQHAKVKKHGTKPKGTRTAKTRHKVSKVSSKLRASTRKKALPRRSIKNTRGKRASTKSATVKATKPNPKVKK